MTHGFVPPKSGQDFDGFLGAAQAMKELGRASAQLQHDWVYSTFRDVNGEPACSLERIPRVSLVNVLGVGTLRLRVGRWFIEKQRARLLDAGPRKAAAHLRKQGVPLEIALLAILGCEERFTHLRGAA